MPVEQLRDLVADLHQALGGQRVGPSRGRRRVTAGRPGQHGPCTRRSAELVEILRDAPEHPQDAGAVEADVVAPHTQFVNIQGEGLTLAIWGPWRARYSRRSWPVASSGPAW